MTTNTGQATPEQLTLICTTQREASADYDTATDAEILEDARNTLCLPGTAAPGALTVEQDGSPFAEALIAFLAPAVDAGGADPPFRRRAWRRPWRRSWTRSRVGILPGMSQRG